MYKKLTKQKSLPLGTLLFFVIIVCISCGSESPSNNVARVQLLEDYSYPTSIAASSNGDKLFVVNNVRNTVSIVDPVSLNPVADITVGCDPRTVIVSEDDSMLVVGHDNNSTCKLSPFYTGEGDGYSYSYLSIIDLTTNTLTKEVVLNQMETSNFTAGQALQSVRDMMWDTSVDPERIYITGIDKSDLAILDMDAIQNAATTQVTFTEETNGEIIGYYKDPGGESFKKPIDLALTSDRKTAFMPQSEAGASGLNVFNLDTESHYASSPWSLGFTYSVESSGSISERPGTCFRPSYIELMSGDQAAVIACTDNDNSFVLGEGDADGDVIIVVDVSDPDVAPAENLTIGYIKACLNPVQFKLTSDEKYLLALCQGSDELITIPWGQFRSTTANAVGTVNIYGLSFKVGDKPSDMVIVGDTVYVTDLVDNRIYKFNYKDETQAQSVRKYAIDPANGTF